MMKFKEYLMEKNPTMKFEKSVYGKHKVIQGYKDYDRIYVVNKGKKLGYCLVTSLPPNMDNMVEIDGEYWFGSQKDIKKAIGM